MTSVKHVTPIERLNKSIENLLTNLNNHQNTLSEINKYYYEEEINSMKKVSNHFKKIRPRTRFRGFWKINHYDSRTCNGIIQDIYIYSNKIEMEIEKLKDVEIK